MKTPQKPKRLAIIGSVGIPANYGGFETLAEQLTVHLGTHLDITVYCSSKAYSLQPKTRNNASLKYIPLSANGLQGILYDIWSAIHAIRKNDTLLFLGITGMIILPFLKIFKAKKIVHIDGLEWRRTKWKFLAKWFLKISEGIAIRFADEIVIDNSALRDMIANIYPKRTYQLLTYGSEIKSEGYEKHFTNGLIPNKAYALALCRIVPENNVKLILDTFKENTDLNLVFIGNWQVNSYSKELHASYSSLPNIDLREPIYDATKIEALRKKCTVYLHGHSAGGTNPSLVEAMRSGIPILVKDVPFNRATMHSQGIFFSDKEDLHAKLKNLASHNLNTYGEKLKKVAEENYNWPLVAKKYHDIF
ncbi:DUF1972 domain-containing protein [Roseivirga sp.]|uniref:DUF1972 domain-containing protein n=1 Tax=Roseivirga sp. TaxID=1964215 RepID=UPI003B8D421C